MILKACEFAAEKHRNQRRKDPARTPYINHPLAVARVLAEEGGVKDPEILSAAILHDTLEDTQTTLKELQKTFGERVAAMVAEVTDDKTLPKQVRKQRQIDHGPRKSKGAAVIKVADKLCNLRDLRQSPPKHWTVERKGRYVEWAREVVSALPIPRHRIRRVFEREYASTSALNSLAASSASLKRLTSTH
jgi:guanosine-3',5'-bis(diphosphate) 3'-pyrophosphohydrolase